MSMRTILARMVMSPEGTGRALGYEVAHKTLLCGPWAQGQSAAQHHLGGGIEFSTGRNLSKAPHWRKGSAVELSQAFALISKQMFNSPVSEQESLQRQKSTENLCNCRWQEPGSCWAPWCGHLEWSKPIKRLLRGQERRRWRLWKGGKVSA